MKLSSLPANLPPARDAMKALANSFHTSDRCQPRLILMKRIVTIGRIVPLGPCHVWHVLDRLVSSLLFSSLRLSREWRFGDGIQDRRCKFRMGVRGATGLPTAEEARAALQDFLEELADLVV